MKLSRGLEVAIASTAFTAMVACGPNDNTRVCNEAVEFAINELNRFQQIAEEIKFR